MNATPATPASDETPAPLQTADRNRVAAMLRALSLFVAIAVAAGLNRMHPPAVVLTRWGDVLRGREALSMLVFTPALVVLMWKLQRLAANNASELSSTLFVLGACILGIGMGMHDTCDLLGRVYRQTAPAAVLKSLDFFDNRLGHWVFFAGFLLVTFAFGWAQTRHPLAAPLSTSRMLAFLGFSLMFAAVMVYNLVFERTARDVSVIALALVVTAVAHARARVGIRRLPLLLLLYPAYTCAVIVPVASWILHGYPAG